MRKDARTWVCTAATVSLLYALAAAPNATIARATSGSVLLLPGRSVSVSGYRISGTGRPGVVRAFVGVTATNTTGRGFTLSTSDFLLTGEGEFFGVIAWNLTRPSVTVAPRDDIEFTLTFDLASSLTRHATLFYRPQGQDFSGIIPLTSWPAIAGGILPLPSLAHPALRTYWVTQGGVLDPWATVTDSRGNLWFAEPGCNFAQGCSPTAPPGQIGEIRVAPNTTVFFRLPSRPGNQPFYLAFDEAGRLWFTTPENSMIGEFDPSRSKLVGQWRVTAGSGPWDLTFAGGQIWYTENLAAAIGDFNPSTHAHRDFPTPSADSQPYGIAERSGLVWFTENNASIDRVGVLNVKTGRISEYPIAQPLNGTPHMITVDASNHPWWTEGFTGTIATLNPTLATPEECGTTAGTCRGVQRFSLPQAGRCGPGTHTSGIAYDARTRLIWVDDSLSSEVGTFNPASGAFTLNTLSDCNAHPYDGLTIDSAGHVWFDEQYGSAIAELTP